LTLASEGHRPKGAREADASWRRERQRGKMAQGRQRVVKAPRVGLRRVLLILLVLACLGPPIWVAIYRFIPPPITILMIERLAQGRGLDRRWVPISDMSPSMVRSVIASEDSRFCLHHGFDMHAIDAALRHNEAKPGKIRGGSTISQQTAKNVFLWPERSWVRKGIEAVFTVLIEEIWGKRRIMEVYLNTIEMGPGIYGVEAASQRYFGVSARDLSPAEAGRLAAILPDPLKWKAAKPGAYVRRRTGSIEARSGTVARDGLAQCVLEP
jgi:monofunctional biosynthetic peptidoglycan transglycosylase